MSSQVALIVGVGQYASATGLSTLQAPVKDANALYDLLQQYSDFDLVPLPKGQRAGGYCVDTRALSAAEFAAEFKGIFTDNPTTAPHAVLLYFSGHGVRREGLAATHSYLAFSDKADAFSLQDLCERIEASAVQQVVVILDCCHSGEVHDFFVQLQGKRFCLIAAASAEGSALAVGGRSVLTQMVLEGLHPEQRDLPVVRTNHLVEFVRAYPHKPPAFLPPSGVSYEFFTLTRKGSVTQTVTPSRVTKPPYKGLLAFQEADADIFFGREALVKVLLARLATARFVAVLGASGSGKSSLVQAGLLPKLRQGHVHGVAWQVVQMRPTDMPLSTLRYELRKVFPFLALAGSTYTADDLGEALRAAAGDCRVLLVIDQFEEVFTECQSLAQREAFFACLLDAVQGENPLSVVLTLRADFLGKCTEQGYSGLSGWLDLGGLLVTPLGAVELADVIRLPLQPTGKRLAPELVSHLIEESLHELGSLPLLAHALAQLWSVAIADEVEVLSLALYRGLSGVDSVQGGLRGVLNRKIHAFYERLSLPQQRLLQWVFLELVQLGEGIEDTRKTVVETELLARQPAHAAAVAALLEVLKSRERLLVGDVNAAGEAVVMLAHEALLRDWGVLREWVNQYRELKRWRERLAGDLRDWSVAQGTEFLLRGARLVEAEEMLAAYGDSLLIGVGEREFITASLVLRRRSRFYQWLRMGGIACLGGFLIVLLSLWWQSEQNLAMSKRNESSMQLSLLEKNIELAISKDQPATAMRLALERLQKLSDTKPKQPSTSEIYDLLLRAMSRHHQGVLQHDAPVRRAIFSPDSKMLLTYAGKHAYLWNRQTRRLQVTLQGHEGDIRSAAFNPDGTHIVTASEDQTARLWSANDGKLLYSLQGHEKSVLSVAFSPDGERIVTTSSDKTARLWNAANGKWLHTLQAHQNIVMSGAFSPDGTRIITASWDNTARLWNASNGEHLIALKHDKNVLSALFSADGTRIVTASSDSTARLWKIDSSQPILLEHQAGVLAAMFNHDDTRIITASEDNTAWLWDSADGKLITSLTGHDDRVWSAIFSPNGQRIVTASEDNTARLWDSNSGQLLNILQGHNKAVRSVMFSLDGMYIVTTSRDNTARLWNSSGQPLPIVQVRQDSDLVGLARFSTNNTIAMFSLEENNTVSHTWFTFKTPKEMIEHAKTLLPSRETGEPGHRFTCAERQRFHLEELARCKK